MRTRIFSVCALALVCVFVPRAGVFAQGEEVRPALDEWPLLTPRALGMGQAFAAMTDDSSVMFFNPAGLINASRKVFFSYSRSIRHVPTGRKASIYLGHKGGNQPDQLNCDLISLSIPTGKNSALALGDSLPGEWGYDFQNEYARKIFGDYGRAAGNLFALSGKFTRTDPSKGGGGELARTFFSIDSPSRIIDKGSGITLQLGFYYEVDDDLFLGATIGRNGPGLWEAFTSIFNDDKSYTTTDFIRLGLSYRPSPYTAANFDVEWKHANVLDEKSRDEDSVRVFMGLERWFFRKVAARIGLRDGNGTYGFGAKIGAMILDYAVAKNLMPDLLNTDVDMFKDVHILGIRSSF